MAKQGKKKLTYYFCKCSIVVLIALIATQCNCNAIEVNVCDGVKDKIFLPYLNDCSKYYLCMNNISIARQCDVGYLFDAKKQSCTYPYEAQCVQNCTAALSSFSYDRTCTKYVLCYAGTPVIRECSDGLQYNPDTDRCDFPQYVDCVDNMCTIFNDPNHITFISSKTSCGKYYICMDGQSYGQVCSNGLKFNTECNCCDFSDRVNCKITAMRRSIASFAKVPPKRSNIKCPVKGVHFFPHEKRADQYHFCMNGHGIILECTPGLIYDALKETCRDPKYNRFILNSKQRTSTVSY